MRLLCRKRSQIVVICLFDLLCQIFRWVFVSRGGEWELGLSAILFSLRWKPELLGYGHPPRGNDGWFGDSDNHHLVLSFLTTAFVVLLCLACGWSGPWLSRSGESMGGKHYPELLRTYQGDHPAVCVPLVSTQWVATSNGKGGWEMLTHPGHLSSHNY